VGGARTALFNWLYARKHGGQFLLRVEDTDKTRSTDESTRAIFEGLSWLGLRWDEEVVYQGANLERHRRDARNLVDRGLAYRCFCTADELEERRKDAALAKETFRYDRRCDRLPAGEVERRVAAGAPFAIRFRVPEGETSWDDVVHGTISVPNKDVDDLVILRSDGTPIYNLAVVSDDIAMRISHVMRGDDHISNTPKQILLYRAIGAGLPRFAHFPMIHGVDGKKLSKRHGAVAVAEYQRKGILPEAMNNFLALLGWSPGGDLEIMTMQDMIEHFSEEGLLRKASVFDEKKLEWMNGQHLSRRSAESLLAPVGAFLDLQATGDFLDLQPPAPWMVAVRSNWQHLDAPSRRAVVDVVKTRSRTLGELVHQAAPLLGDAIEYDQAAVAGAWNEPAMVRPMLAAIRDRLGAVSSWEPPTLQATLRALAAELEVSDGTILPPLRVALTGLSVSPGIFEVLVALGREKSLARIAAAERHLEDLAGAA